MTLEANAADAATFCLKELAKGSENASASCNPYPNEMGITKDNIADITDYWLERAGVSAWEDAEGPDTDPDSAEAQAEAAGAPGSEGGQAAAAK